MAYERPGVYVRETPISSAVATRVSQTVTAFLGTADRGPTTPTYINSWSQYKQVFGELDTTIDLGYALYHFFANGGRDAYITRVVGTSSVASTAVFSGTVSGASAPSTILTLQAASTGTWGDDLSVEIVFDKNSLEDPEGTPYFKKATVFSLIVSLTTGSSTVEVERWQELSVDPTSSRFIKDVLDNFSKYVKVSGSVTTISASADIAVAGVSAGDYTISLTFSGGANGSAVTSSNWATAVDAQDSVDGPAVMNLVGQTSATIVNDALSYADNRGDVFVIIDCPLTDTSKANIQSTISSYNSSGSGAVYFPSLKMVDPARSGPAAIRNTYAGGAVAGAYARSEATRGVAKAPAGYTLDIRNVVSLNASISDADQGELYNSDHVNLFRVVPGVGAIINGARTLSKVRPDKFITVRRSLNYLRTVLKNQTEFAVFEPNDQRLWDKINNRLNASLTAFWASGGLKGATPGEAFYIVCDSTNNTESSIDDGFVNIDVGVALQNPAEFIVINISQYSGGLQ